MILAYAGILQRFDFSIFGGDEKDTVSPPWKAGARHSSSASRAHCCHSRRRGRHGPYHSDWQNATDSGRRRHSSHRKRTVRAAIPFCVETGAGGGAPSGRLYAGHSPRFLPAPESRGAPNQASAEGARLPHPAARPAEAVSYRMAKRHGQRTPAPSEP